MTELYAQPYSIEHTGFYFDSIESFDKGMEQLNKKGCEEVEIQFIDGELSQARLFKAACIDQSNIGLWFDELEDIDGDAINQLCFLLDRSFGLDDALTRYEWVCLYHGKATDYAYDLLEETTEIPENLRCYINYEAIARDMEINGEIEEIEHEMIVTNAHEF